jgi:hypothetical protein
LRAGAALSRCDVVVLQDYFDEWAGREIWDHNPCATDVDRKRLEQLRASVKVIEDEQDVLTWVVLARALGMDPL